MTFSITWPWAFFLALSFANYCYMDYFISQIYSSKSWQRGALDLIYLGLMYGLIYFGGLIIRAQHGC